MNEYLDSFGGFLESAGNATNAFKDAFDRDRDKIKADVKSEGMFTPQKIALIIGGVVVAAIALKFAFGRR